MSVLRTEEAGARLSILIGEYLNHSVTSKYHHSNVLKVNGTSEFGLVQGFVSDATEQSGLTASLCCKKT